MSITEIANFEYNGKRNGKKHERPDTDLAAEQAVISACLNDTQAVAAATAAGLAAEHFVAGNGHADVWRAIIEVAEAGWQPDVATVADQLATNHADGITGAQLIELQAVPLAYKSNVARYAEILIAHAVTRAAKNAITDASEQLRLGAEPRTVITRIADRLPAPVQDVDDYVELDDFLNTDDPEHNWVIPELLEEGDRCIITAVAGTGKSTMLRQIGLMACAGLHPFTLADIDPVRVLLIDVENSEQQVRRELRPLRKAAGHRYKPGMFRLSAHGESINLADPATLATISSAVEKHQPGIILCGPLYKLISGNPIDEEPARVTAAAFDRLRHICGSAILIEAHSPYAASGAKKREVRPYGASLWERWPEYGWYFSAVGDIEHWRGQREERAWPAAIQRSHPWPWAQRIIETTTEREPWDGPTNCINAIAHYLEQHPDDELSARQLETVLRATGNGYRQQTVREAAERAAAKNVINVRIGPRQARLYSHPNQEKVDTSDPGF